METRLTYKQFESRLTDLTRIGNPTIMGTPFGIFTIFDLSGKPFYGKFDQSEFQLTRNTTFPLPTGYVVKGTYRKTESGHTKLDYEIRPIWFSYYWARFFPFFCFIFINGVLLFNLKTLQWDIVLTLNGFCALMSILAIGVDKVQKWRLEKRFQAEFEVEDNLKLKTI